MNYNAKNSQQVFVFFYFEVDKNKIKIHKKHWLKLQYLLAKF